MTTTPASTFDEVQRAVADVEGWMTPGQARRLTAAEEEILRALALDLL